MICPKCGEKAIKTGFRKTEGRHKQRWKCNICKTPKGWPFKFTEGALIEMEQPSNKSFEELGNQAIATYKGSQRITTLESLLEACDVDLNVWEVDRWIANQWPVTMRLNDLPTTVEQFQIKAWLIRREPIKHEWPAVQPIIAHKPVNRPKVKASKSDLTTVLFIPDLQVGFLRDIKTGELTPMHDEKAMDLVLQVAEMSKPDKIVLIGDALDLSEWSDRFIKSPEFYFTTQPALEALHEFLAALRVHTSEFIYLEGNHEQRMERAIVSNIMAAYSLHPANQPDAPASMGIKGLLDLDGLDIEYISPYPHAHVWLNNNLKASHGTVARRGSGDTVKAMLAEARNSEIVGHSHRLEMASKTTHPRVGPRTYIIYNIGTLCSLESGVVPANSTNHNWQQGFGFGWVQEDGGHLFDMQLYPIYGGKTIFQGEFLTARKED